MEQAAPREPHGTDRSWLHVRGKLGGMFEDKGGGGNHSGDHEIVGF